MRWFGSLLCCLFMLTFQNAAVAAEGNCLRGSKNFASKRFFNNRIDRSRHVEVDSSRRLSAFDILGSRKFIEIDEDVVPKLVLEKFIRKPAGGHLYLVRAIRATEGGAFSAFIDGKVLLILHGDLGSYGCKDAIDTALIVAMDGKLRDVIAGASTSQ